jgi:hypothetical protein
MQFLPPSVPSSPEELIRVRADAARQARELDMVRVELTALQPIAWRSPASRAFAESLTEVGDSLARVRSTLDEGIRALAAQP